MAHLSGSSDRQQKNSARINFDKVKKSTMAVNADLMQYTYIEDQLEKDGGSGLRKSRDRTARSGVAEGENKVMTENSILRTEDDRNVVGDTMNSNPATHRNSFNKPVQPKYGLDQPINLGLTQIRMIEKDHIELTQDLKALD